MRKSNCRWFTSVVDVGHELINTGVFDQDRYFDVFVEYAKASPDDILIQITVCNRGPEPATLHVLPSLWFRNTWSWGGGETRPMLEFAAQTDTRGVIAASHPKLGQRYLYCDGAATLLFTENDTNTERISSELSRVRPQEDNGPFGDSFDEVMRARRQEADEFYASITPPSMSADAANVMRQALAGMLWSKQFYFYDLNKWLVERGFDPYKPKRRTAPRNNGWHHMYNADVISMPNKWEYPWYAAWDLAFHAIALTMVDPDFGKQQLDLILREPYMHPNGQIPAYEWNFGDVNPPVHAWATIFTYRLEQAQTGQGDLAWLQRCFQKLFLNFTWWVNRKDRSGKNVFEGGFLGLDNIGVFDRNAPLPTGGYLEQADGTAWMALYCQNMLEIAVELSMSDTAFAEMALKFAQHFLWIASAMIHAGDDTGMWDEEDGFFYDVLRLPNGQAQRLKMRSMVGLLPLCAATVFEGEMYKKYPEVAERMTKFYDARPELSAFIHDSRKQGYAGRRLGSILDETKLSRVLSKMLDENEFLSPYGIRALSRYHAEHPYVFRFGDQEFRVSYLPAESDGSMFGGNSNWRGPIWMPVNGLIIRALMHCYGYYGNDFTVERPTGSGRQMNLYQVAEEITRRLSAIFLRGPDGRRPVFGGTQKFQEDAHWRDCLQFYEYFHGDNGAGLGASHQTGWTGIIARAMHTFASVTAEQLLEGGRKTYMEAAAQGASGQPRRKIEASS